MYSNPSFIIPHSSPCVKGKCGKITTAVVTSLRPAFSLQADSRHTQHAESPEPGADAGSGQQYIEAVSKEQPASHGIRVLIEFRKHQPRILVQCPVDFVLPNENQEVATAHIPTQRVVCISFSSAGLRSALSM